MMMGCAGHDFIKTPNLDKLAARGTRFTSVYTPSPICVPARAAFASGQYVHKPPIGIMPHPTLAAPGAGDISCKRPIFLFIPLGSYIIATQMMTPGLTNVIYRWMVKDGVGMIWASIRNEQERLSTYISHVR